MEKNNDLKSFGYQQELKRVFGLWQLTAYGLNFMIPIAPAIIFGFVLTTSGGSVALPYLFAFFGTLFTAMGYAYFIRRYPLAGSVYNYVSKSINLQMGFIAGWAILLDYILVPTLTAMSASAFLHNLLPGLPYEFILLMFIGCTGLLNLAGADPLAKLGLSMLIIGEIVIFSGFIVWAYGVHVNHVGVGHLFSEIPFHFKSFNALTSATSIAMLSYLGFDAITTLAEEAKSPKKDVPKAIFYSLILGSLTMFLTGYIGSLVVPDWQQYIHDENWLNTTLFFVSQRTGGQGFVMFYTVGFVVAMAVFNVVATTGASRVLYSISRDKVIPISSLSYINPKTQVPAVGIILIVLAQLIVGTIGKIDLIAEVVNFGALFGFLLLNIAYFVHILRFNSTKRSWWQLPISIIGALLNLWLLSHLAKKALIIGTLWILLGIIFFAISRSTRKKLR